MKNNWQTKKLGEVCVLKSGTTISSKLEKFSGDILYTKVGDMNLEGNEINITTSSRFVNISDIKKSQIIPIGSVIFPKRGGAIFTNKKRKIVKPTIVDLNIMAIVPSEKMNEDFLYYWFQRINLSDLNNGSSVPQINNYSFDDIYIPFPESLPEQHRIVKILDEVFEGIAKAKENAEKNLQNARELFESYLQSVFANAGDGWEEKKLGECFKLKSGDNITSKMMIENAKFPVYGGNGIAGMYDKFNLSGSNIIIGRVGALCGNVRHITKEIWLTDNAFKITDCKYDFDHAFLTYLLNFKNLRTYARQAAQPVISNSSLEDVLLKFPKSLPIQRSIVSKLDALSAETKKLETVYTQKLSDLDELKKSILQKAFSGEL